MTPALEQLLDDLETVINKRSRTEETLVQDVISATATMLVLAIRQFPDQTSREFYVEDCIAQLRQIIYGPHGHG